MGINISNIEFIISVNEIILQYNSDRGIDLKSLIMEEMLVRIVNKIEVFIEDFQENGFVFFLKKYYNRWFYRYVIG